MAPTRHRFEYRFYREEDPGQFGMPQTGLMTTLVIDLDAGGWSVENVPVTSSGRECAPDDPDASHVWTGRGDSQQGAILNWLADRLGLTEDDQVWVEGRYV